MYKNYSRFRKLDVFGIGSAIGGGAQAVGNVGAALITAGATKDAARQAYEGQVATNQANIDINNATNLANREISEGVNQANLQLAEKQNQWNIEQWNRENAYNSPANQMKLYRQAGLNPALAQGQFSPAQPLQSASLANQQMGIPMQPTKLDNPNALSSQIKMQGALQQSQYFKDMVSNAVDVAKGLTDIKKTTTDIDKTKEDIKNVYLQNKKLDIETFILDKSKSAQLKRIFLENKKLLGESKLVMQSLKTETEKTEYQKYLNEMQNTNNEILHKTAKWLIKEPEARVKKLFADAAKSASEGQYQQFLLRYAQENNRGLPSSSIDLLIQSIVEGGFGKQFAGMKDVLSDPTKFMINFFKNAIGNGVNSLRQAVNKAYDYLQKLATEGYYGKVDLFE